LGGPWMRPFMLKWVARVSKECVFRFSATNGIWDGRMWLRQSWCGLYTVQTCTAIFSVRRVWNCQNLITGLDRYLDERGIKSVEEIRGKTLPQIRSFETLERRDKGEVWSKWIATFAITVCFARIGVSTMRFAPEYEEDGTPNMIKENCEVVDSVPYFALRMR